jgi:Capsule assembly protein Wzi
MKIKNILLFLAFLAAGQNIFAQNPASVPLNHPVYGFLERMETLGEVENLLDGVKPYSRARVAVFLQKLYARSESLTSIDKRKLDDFLLDFRFEISKEKKHALIPTNKSWYSTLAGWQNFKNDFWRVLDQKYPEEENHVAMWEEGADNFYFDYEQLFTFDGRSDKLSRNANEQSYIFRGTIENDFAYQVKISLQGIRGDEGYREQDPIIKNGFQQESETGDIVFTDRTGGELAWHTKYMDIIFAQQEISWGQGESGKLILSNYPEQYPYLQISKDWGWGKFTAMHGKLQSFKSDTLSDGSRLYPDKWVAAHRLEIAPWGNFTIGLNEVFIYGNRYADWAYLIPFNFYRAAQHKLRDRDNATISLDFEYIPVNGLKLYTTVFLDEMKFEKLGTNWWGNKQAIQSGFHIADPFGLPNLELRMEYSAIMPWVYTHKFKINRYESDGRSLGHWAGPNSEVFYFHLMKEFHARLKGGVQVTRYKKGANPDSLNVGGDLLTGRNILGFGQEAPKETRTFLEGDLTTTLSTKLYLQYEVFNDLYLSASYIWVNTENKNIRTKRNEFHFGFLFNY